MASREPAPPRIDVANDVGLTVYGCEPDEADLFAALSPRFGVAPTMTRAPASETHVVPWPANRCISVGHKSEVSAPTLRALREAGVEYISTRSIGLDHIDLHAAERLGITVENVVYAPDGVADYTVMLILMLIRSAPATIRAADRNDFRLRRTRGHDLCDMTVGVVGTGNIGHAVIRRLHGFGCRVLVHTGRPGAMRSAHEVSLDELLVTSDVVTLHVPLNSATRHVIGREQLASMPAGAFLVNTGRGALVDTEALIGALARGHLGGAALDVLEDEEDVFYVDCTTGPIDHRFLPRLQQLPNTIITPHTAYYTRRTLHDTVERTLVNCLHFERSRLGEATDDRDLVRGLLGRA